MIIQQSAKLGLSGFCALFYLLMLQSVGCAALPDRDADADRRDVENQISMRPEELNRATTTPADETLLTWLLDLENTDVTEFSRAKTRLLPHKAQVAALLKATWLNKSDPLPQYAPVSDDATQTAIEIIFTHQDESGEAFNAAAPWRQALRAEIHSWFGDKAAERRPLLLVRSLDWLTRLEGGMTDEGAMRLIALLRRPEPEIRWKAATLLLTHADKLKARQVDDIIKVLQSETVAIRRDAGRLALGIWSQLSPRNVNLATPRLTFNPEASSATRRVQINALLRWAESFFLTKAG